MQLTDGETLYNTILNAPFGICILNADTFIAESVNHKFLQLTGKDLDTVFDRFYWDVFEEVRRYHESKVADIVQSGNNYYAELIEPRQISSSSAQMPAVRFVYSPVKNTNGKIAKIAVWLIENEVKVVVEQYNNSVFQLERDQLKSYYLQEQQKAKEESDQQKRVYETITSGTPDLIYVFDLNYRFTYANQALLTMWGKTWENSVGKGLLENGYEPWHAEIHEREIDKVRETKQPIRGEVSFPHATLGRRVYDYIFTPVLNELGEVEAVAGTTRDVTERKQFEESLAYSSEKLQVINEELAAVNEEQAASNEELMTVNEELAAVNRQLLAARQKIDEAEIALRLAIDAANFGTWYIHSGTRQFITDARLKELFGYYAHEEISIEQTLAQITNEYREYVSNKLENALYHNGDYDVTYPVVGLHDNKLRWLRAIGNLKADPSGSFSAFTGVVMDITEQYLAAKKIERAEESLRIATESGELGTWYYEKESGIFDTSPRFNKIFGLAEDIQPTYKQALERVREDHRERVTNAVNASFNNGSNFNIEYPVTLTNEEERWVRSVGKMVKEPNSDAYLTGVLADITEQKQDEIRKNDFIGMVSHELKTPLTSLNALLQVAALKTKNSEDGFLADTIQKSNMQVKRMTTMINGFLNISRLESGKIHIEKQPFDIGTLIDDTIAEAKLTVSTHAIHFDGCQELQLNADRDKIGSVISNFISNAVKYSPKGKNITVKCSLKDNQAVVSVTDEGLGIKQDDLERIFDRYYRVETSHTRHISGFGIGLYLSSEIIERHGGRVWAESESGVGSTFYFSLPV